VDAVDLSIIRILKGNARATSSEISKTVHLSVPAVSERIRKLEEKGLISGYTLRMNREKLGLKLVAFIFVTLEGTADTQVFREAVMQQECVYECHHIAGSYDYLIKVVLEDTRALEEFISIALRNKLKVSRTNTNIVLSTLKEEL